MLPTTPHAIAQRNEQVLKEKDSIQTGIEGNQRIKVTMPSNSSAVPVLGITTVSW